MKSRSIICLLAALSAMAGILMTTSCSLEGSDYYINGTIGGNTHNKSGYVSAEAVFGETLLLAADSQADFYAGNNCWIIYFSATTAGTYTSDDGAMVLFSVSSSAGYMSDMDISVVVSTYTSAEIAGTFSGTMIYSLNMLEYPVSGEFRVQF